MSKRGRPRKQGARTKTGRLVVLVDRGNQRVQARSDRFAKCQGGKAGGQISDSIGRLWAVGWLDGTDYDAAILRDEGRRYGKLYWSNYADLAPKMGKAERGDRSANRGAEVDPSGERFRRLDAAARRRGRDAYAAMQQLCVDDWWFPDIDPQWIARLLDARLKRTEPDMADVAKLALAKQGLCAMLDGPARVLDVIPMHRLTGT